MLGKRTFFKEVTMKRTLCLLFAASLILAVGCGSTPKKPRVSYSQPKIADGTDYDNSVVIENGALSGSAFNWEFFVKKASANLAAKVVIIVKNGDSSATYAISYSDRSYMLDDGVSVSVYKYLAVFEANLSGGTYSVGVLSDKEGVTLEEFFGGSVPGEVSVGMSTDAGTVVFAYKK